MTSASSVSLSLCFNHSGVLGLSKGLILSLDCQDLSDGFALSGDLSLTGFSGDIPLLNLFSGDPGGLDLSGDLSCTRFSGDRCLGGD